MLVGSYMRNSVREDVRDGVSEEVVYGDATASK